MALEEQNEAMIGLLRRSLARDDVGGTCPEPELLAAYYEHSLTGQEAAHFDRHISTCSRCREGLAAMVRADDVRPKPKAVWLVDWRLLSAAAAVMVVLTVWFVRRPERNAPIAQTVGAPLSATTQEPSTRDDRAALAPNNNRGGVPANSLKAARKTEPASGAARTNSDFQSRVAERIDEKKAASTGVMSKAPVAGSGGKQTENGQNVQTDSADVATAQKPGSAIGGGQGYRMAPAQNARAGHSASGQQQQTQQIQASSQMVQVQANPPQPASPSTASAPPVPAPPNSANDSALAATSQSETVELAQEPQAHPTANAKAKQTLANAYAENSGAALQTLEQRSAGQVIDTPIPSVKWRISAAGFVERSEDGGATWHGQEPDPEAHLVAGSAPTEKVCWLVGKEGVVLVTKDAANWKKIPPPVAADLTSVSAKSASAATVTTSDGRRFTTHNEGKKWKPVE